MSKSHHHSKSAMKHKDAPGSGAAKRKHIKDPKSKIATVFKEYERGTLRSGGSGKHVTSKSQATAIALSEARRAGAKIPLKKK